MEQDKQCSRCGKLKPPEAFPRNKNRKSGRDAECKRCKRLRESTEEALMAKRDRDLRRMYGISLSAYTLMLDQQGGVCAICRQPERGLTAQGERKPLAVDHDHQTGAVRSLLCTRCNKGLGAFRDDLGLLMAAVNYLRGQALSAALRRLRDADAPR